MALLLGRAEENGECTHAVGRIYRFKSTAPEGKGGRFSDGEHSVGAPDSLVSTSLSHWWDGGLSSPGVTRAGE